MDPKANLAEQLRLADEILELSDSTPRGQDIDANTLEHKATRLAELVKALAEWNKSKE